MADKRFVAKNGLDNNNQTITNVSDPQNAQDAATKAFASNASNLTSGTVNAARLPAAPDFATVTADALQFDAANPAATTAVGQMTWNPDDGTLDLGLKGGNVTLQLGQQEFVRVVNPSGSTLTKGQVVYIAGAQGNRVRVALARSDSELTSLDTLGIVAESIASEAEGFVITAGLLRNINTSAWAEGAVLWLSNTTAGALTTTRPVAPNHGVQLGFVVRAHASVGIVFVQVQNGYELDELHNILIASPSTGDLLRYDGTKWINEAPTSANTGSKVVVRDASGNFAAGTITATLVGNASTATALATGRTISVTGDVTGTSSAFDGTANVSFATTLANSGVSAGTYGSSTAVPVVTVDAKGRVTSVTTSSISGSLTFTGDVTGTGSTGTSTALTLANSGVVAGTYTKVTVDAKGRVTTGASLASGDLPTYTGTISSSQVTTGLGFTPENVANKGVANGYASLDSGGKVPSAQLPSYVDDVLEYANTAGFPGTGESGKIYVALDVNKVYRWSGSAYVEISPSPGSTDAVAEGSTNLYFTNTRARNAISVSGSLGYNAGTGVISYTQPTNVSTFSNDSGYITSSALSPYLTTSSAASTYAPLNGTGASGTWGISISGSAAQLGGLSNSRYHQSARDTFTSGDWNSMTSHGTYKIQHASFSADTNPPPASYAYGICEVTVSEIGGETRINQIYWPHVNDSYFYQRMANSGSWTAWNKIWRAFGGTALDSSNYNSYSPTLTGTGASGTWAINISGNAATATSATDSTKLPLAGGTLTGKVTFPSAVANRPQFPEGILGLDTGDGNFDIWGISREYYPSHGTAGNAWGIRWDGDSNQVRFIGAGTVRLAVDLDGGASALTWEGNAVLHAGNYNSYSPTLTGTGASGTWGINITGSASKYGGFIGDANNDRNLRIYGGTNGDMGILGVAANGSFRFQLYGDSGANYGFLNGAWAGWDLQKTTNGQLYLTVSSTVYTALHSGNYNSYAPTLTGGGASGTWGINISGNAGGATTVFLQSLGTGSVNVNNGNLGVYRNENGSGAALAYAPVLHVGGGDTMWQVQGTYGTSGNGTFYFRQGYNGSWGNWLTMLSSANYNNYSPTLTGTGASGTWGIRVTGFANQGSARLYSTDASYNYDSANPYFGYLTYDGSRWLFQVSPATPAAVRVAYADSAGSADQIDGWGFVNTGSNAGVNADTIDSNGISYYTAGVTNFSGNSTDGALYSQRYSTSWQHQIAADYRSGQIALRGRNNGTWQSWRTVLDSSNYTSYSPSLTGSGASGTWGISISGNASTASQVGGYTSDGWLRKVGDSTQFQIYGNTRTIVFRTDGVTNPHGGGGYPYIWYYGGSGDSERRMILHTNGDLWTNSYGWLQDYFASYSTANSRYSRKDTTNQWIKPYYEYGSYLTGETPANLRDQMGGGGLRVDFLHPGYTGSGGWNHVITWSGYNVYNMYQLGAHYDGGTGTDLWVRSEANHGGTSWTAWRRILTSTNYNSYAIPLSGGTLTGGLTVQNSTSAITLASGYTIGMGDWGMRNTTPYGWIQFGPANASWAHIYADRTFYFNQELYVNGNQVLHASNYNSYAPTLTGGGASGTWNINITGNVSGTVTGPINSGTNTNYIARHLEATSTWAAGGATTLFLGWSTGSVVIGNNAQGVHDHANAGGANRTYMGNPVYAHSYRTWGNVAGTGAASYHPDGIYSTGTNWLYGTMYLNNNNINGVGSISASSVGATSVSGSDVYTTGGWFRNHTNNNGIYWSGTGWHLYPRTVDDFYVRSGTGDGALQFLRSDGTTMGYVHWASDSAIGFLTSGRSWRLRTDNSGNTQTYGTMYASGDVIAYYSDERLKTKVGRIDNALEKVKSLEGFWYVENDLAKSLGYNNDKQQVGVSAQQVQAVMPEAVTLAPADRKETPNGETESKSGENYLTVKYERLVPLLIEAIKEQQARIESLEARLNALS